MSMRLRSEEYGPVRSEVEVARDWMSFSGAEVLELGCGRAEATRELAQACPDARFTALEVDTVQHSLNLGTACPSNVHFALGGAQDIPAEDQAFDAVLMFKSLHHVPVALMRRALAEIHRVLRPTGLAGFIEPVFAGEYNEVLRIFHDEQQVRERAFEALCDAVASRRFELRAQVFFARRVHFDSFAHFERMVIGVTHTHHRLDAGQFAAVRERFMRHAGPEGAEFLQPMRLDLLHKPADEVSASGRHSVG